MTGELEEKRLPSVINEQYHLTHQKYEGNKIFIYYRWDKVFKNRPSKIWGRQCLKNFKWDGLPKQTLFQIMVGEQYQENSLSTGIFILWKESNSLCYWEQLVLTQIKSMFPAYGNQIVWFVLLTYPLTGFYDGNIGLHGFISKISYWQVTLSVLQQVKICFK